MPVANFIKIAKHYKLLCIGPHNFIWRYVVSKEDQLARTLHRDKRRGKKEWKESITVAKYSKYQNTYPKFLNMNNTSSPVKTGHKT